MPYLFAALLRNGYTAQPKARRSALVICLILMALFAYSTSNVLAASVMVNNAAIAGTVASTRPIDIPLLANTNCPSVTQIPTTECDVLVLLFATTNGSGWTTKNGWNVDNLICSWTGITCAGGHVVQLSLGGNNLSGSLPDLSRLPNLQILDLSHNTLSGSLPSFSGLPNLQNLALNSNSFSGSLPSFSGLMYLQNLNLGFNTLSGSLPSFSGLPNLQYLYLSNNTFSGSFPSFSGLTSLSSLNLSNNQLNGQVPSLIGLTSLRQLYLNNNTFTGDVPDLPPSLQNFNISNNLLNGTIPNSLTSTAIPVSTPGFQDSLALCGTGNILTPINASVNSFIAARITGWAGVCGSPATTTHFSVTGFPSSSAAGTAGTITVTALNASNSTVTSYSGTVKITSSDAAAGLPANAALTNGVGTFAVVLITAGTQTITATDTVTASITGTQSGIVVTATAAANFIVNGFPAFVTAGISNTVTVTAKDTYGNTATKYTGTVKITSSDAAAVLPVNAALTSGVGTFSVTLKTVGAQTITATDTVTAAITGAQSGIVVTANDTVGIYRVSNNTFYLRNSNVTGTADIIVQFGSTSTSYPIMGDWNGDGVDTIGIYETANSQFSLRDSNTAGLADYTLTLGYPGDQPISGRWTSDMTHTGVGVFRPSNGILYLKKTLTTGFAEFSMVLGTPGDIGIAGDWNGDGIDGPGVFRPTNNTFFLTDQVTQGPVFGDYSTILGVSGDQPIVGDWTGLGHAGIGVFRPSDGQIYLKNVLTTGYADAALVYGIPNDIPVAGYWANASSVPINHALNNLIVPGAPLTPATATPMPAQPHVIQPPQHNYDG